MFEVWNENYYIDLDKLDEFTQFMGESGETNIHVVKYETTKLLLDVLLTEDGEVDENLGMKSTELSIPFKLAFNTLLMKKIINKI
jgi:hypothetical protein